MKNNNFMLSDIYMTNDITKLERREDGYYLGNYKYLNIEDYLKYACNTFNEMSDGIIKKEYYYKLKHYGSYDTIYNTYKKLLEIIKDNNEKIVGLPMEHFISGRWNKDNEKDYETEIMIPVEIKL